MDKVTVEEMYKIEPLYEGWNDSPIWSCLEGCMGDAWVDDITNPTAAQIIVADFCYFAGDSQSLRAKELVSNIPARHTKVLFMVPQNEDWSQLIEEVYPNNHERVIRYQIKNPPAEFDTDKLLGYIEQMPEGYYIRQIDEELYNIASEEEFSSYFCFQFQSYEDFKERGLGFAVMYGDKWVAGASSYTMYKEGIEIELDTKEGYRRKGLALAVAARLILECVERGLSPNWDAANMQSARIAERLGYTFDQEYPAYVITNFR